MRRYGRAALPLSRRLAPKAAKGLALPVMTKAEDERKQRLAEALRQNLRRRKAQARGEEAVPADTANRHSRESGYADDA